MGKCENCGEYMLDEEPSMFCGKDCLYTWASMEFEPISNKIYCCRRV